MEEQVIMNDIGVSCRCRFNPVGAQHRSADNEHVPDFSAYVSIEILADYCAESELGIIAGGC